MTPKSDQHKIRYNQFQTRYQLMMGISIQKSVLIGKRNYFFKKKQIAAKPWKKIQQEWSEMLRFSLEYLPPVTTPWLKTPFFSPEIMALKQSQIPAMMAYAQLKNMSLRSTLTYCTHLGETLWISPSHPTRLNILRESPSTMIVPMSSHIKSVS